MDQPLSLSRVDAPVRPVQWGKWAFAGARVVIATGLLSLLVIRIVWGAPATNHMAFLANAFNHGSFDVGRLPENYADTITVGERVYLPMGPAPAMLLMPFVGPFGITFDEFWLALGLSLANAWLLNLILRRIGIVATETRRWLLALFLLGTIYLAALTIGRSWFLAHICTTLFLLLAIEIALREGSALAIGLLIGMAFLTRSTTLFGLPFFFWLMWHQARRQPAARKDFSFRVLYLGGGLMLPLAFFFVYNFARFGSPLDTGYARALPGIPVLREALSYGLFSPVHIPKNLYMLLLSAPQPYPDINSPVLEFPYIMPSRWGMGILFTTPAFVYAFLANRRDRLVQAAWLGVLGILPFLLLYYGIGYDQFGSRYALDFYPFLFLVTGRSLATRLNRFARTLILLCIAVNIWGAWSVEFGRLLPLR